MEPTNIIWHGHHDFLSALMQNINLTPPGRTAVIYKSPNDANGWFLWMIDYGLHCLPLTWEIQNTKSR